MTWPATWRPLAHARCAWWRQRQKDQRSELSVLYLFCGRGSSDRSFQVQHKSDFDFHRWIIDENVWISTKYLSIFEERHLIYMLTTFFWDWSYLSGRIFDSKCSRRRIDGRESAAFYLLYVHKWLVATIDCKAFKKYYNSKITTKAVHTIK